MFQKVFNDILSNLEYDNIPFEVVTENGKSVIRIDCGNKIGKNIIKYFLKHSLASCCQCSRNKNQAC